jgi:hypothetical protein
VNTTEPAFSHVANTRPAATDRRLSGFSRRRRAAPIAAGAMAGDRARQADLHRVALAQSARSGDSYDSSGWTTALPTPAISRFTSTGVVRAGERIQARLRQDGFFWCLDSPIIEGIDPLPPLSIASGPSSRVSGDLHRRDPREDPRRAGRQPTDLCGVGGDLRGAPAVSPIWGGVRAATTSPGILEARSSATGAVLASKT